jgi:hypothetical protein
MRQRGPSAVATRRDGAGTAPNPALKGRATFIASLRDVGEQPTTDN